MKPNLSRLRRLVDNALHPLDAPTRFGGPSVGACPICGKPAFLDGESIGEHLWFVDQVNGPIVMPQSMYCDGLGKTLKEAREIAYARKRVSLPRIGIYWPYL